jgi:hypothetical protein
MSEASLAEKRATLFECSFNRAVKIRNKIPDLTSNAGVLLLREADHRLGVTASLAARLHDPRNPKRTRYSMEELLRERLYAMVLGYPHQDDLDNLAHVPAIRAGVWNCPGERVADERLASQPTTSRLLSILSRSGNIEALRSAPGQVIAAHQKASGEDRRVKLGVVDVDGFPVEVHGNQPGAQYNGYYKSTVYSPLAAFFSVNGDFSSRRLGEGFLHAILRKGTASAAAGAKRFISQASAKAKRLAQKTAFRIDAGFASAEVLNHIDRLGDIFTSRLPHNAVLERLAEPYLVRPANRPLKEGCQFAIELKGYLNPKWSKTYRVVLVVVDKPELNGNLALWPEYFFLVTNWPENQMPTLVLLQHYRQRGTFEDRFGELNAMGLKLSYDDFRRNEAELLLHLLAFNLAETLRSEMEAANDPRPNPPASNPDGGWDIGRFINVVLKIAAALTHGGRRLRFDLAEGAAWLWKALLSRLERWRWPASCKRPPEPKSRRIVPAPSHSFLCFNYRF